MKLITRIILISALGLLIIPACLIGGPFFLLLYMAICAFMASLMATIAWAFEIGQKTWVENFKEVFNNLNKQGK